MSGKNIVLTFLAAIACALLLETCNSAPEVARELGPIPRATATIALSKREQEAQVTATYISVLESEVISDTAQTHTIARAEERQDFSRSETFANFWNWCKIVMVGACTFGIASVSIGAGVLAGSSLTARGVENVAIRLKRAIHLPVSAPLPDSAHIMLVDGQTRLLDTRTRGTWNVVQDQNSSPEHSEALAIYRTGAWRVLGQALATSGSPTKAQIQQMKYLLGREI